MSEGFSTLNTGMVQITALLQGNHRVREGLDRPAVGFRQSPPAVLLVSCMINGRRCHSPMKATPAGRAAHPLPSDKATTGRSVGGCPLARDTNQPPPAGF
jgi:hypothetical protein